MTILRIRELADDFGPLAIWRRPMLGSQYVIGVDVSEGRAPTEQARSIARRAEQTLDYSCAMVLESDTAALCASWHGSVDTHVFSKEIYRLGIYYNTALVAVETSGLGISVEGNLQEWEYPNLFYEDMATGAATDVSGYRSSKRKKGLLIDSIFAYLSEDDAYIPDVEVLREMQTMQRIPNKGHGAIENYKDDRVFAFGIGHYVLREERPTHLPVGAMVDPYASLPFEEAEAWKMIHGRRGRKRVEDN